MPHSATAPWTLTARWVFPVDQPPLERGIITIAADRIVAIEPSASRTADIDLGDTAVMPGLVNAHTHLDLSGLRGKCPPTPDFTDWLRAVIRHRRSQPSEQIEADSHAGLMESLKFGTTLLGDIASEGASWAVLGQAHVRAVVYYELLGLPHERALKALSAARNWLYAHSPTPTCRPGWSPHAPYSVSAFAFENAHGYGHRATIPVATHLGETLAEQQLLDQHAGPLLEFLQQLEVWAPGQLARNWDDVISLTAAARPLAYIHGNYLPTDAPIPAHAAIVYCPRTHAAFGHPPHPFREFLARGVRVALGTDSLASNPDLDVLAEARFVHQKHPDVAGATLLRMITLSGAEALGWADETGSLTPGKSADLVVVPLPSAHAADPHLLFLESAAPVHAVLFRGKWRSGPYALPNADSSRPMS